MKRLLLLAFILFPTLSFGKKISIRRAFYGDCYSRVQIETKNQDSKDWKLRHIITPGYFSEFEIDTKDFQLIRIWNNDTFIFHAKELEGTKAIVKIKNDNSFQVIYRPPSKIIITEYKPEQNQVEKTEEGLLYYTN